jgi:hypothetical protein
MNQCKTVASSVLLNPDEICKCDHEPGVVELPLVQIPIAPHPSEADSEVSKILMDAVKGVPRFSA